MAECSAAGVHPHVFWDYTYREIYAVLAGAGIRARRDHKLTLWGAWQSANLHKAKRLPDLKQLLRKLDPRRVMSVANIRAEVMSIAAAMGAKVIHRKRREE